MSVPMIVWEQFEKEKIWEGCKSKRRKRIEGGKGETKEDEWKKKEERGGAEKVEESEKDRKTRYQ